ncbi:hypothetical protein KCP78_15740 [Salmonella enterica subsp. enterica]|nr:hypothetical protein KCP78_15740 [Salmonella enterica subsp. enterica]
MCAQVSNASRPPFQRYHHQKAALNSGEALPRIDHPAAATIDTSHGARTSCNGWVDG